MKKVLSLVLVLTLVLGSFSFAFAAPASDVAGTEYANAVETLNVLNIMTGYEDGTFKPENQITRAEFAALVVRALGQEGVAKMANATSTFSDVPAKAWYTGYVNVAASLKIVNGMGDGSFAPNAPVTYEQAVTMIMRALGYEPDATEKGGYPLGYMLVAGETGVTKDVKGVMGVPATRGIVAQLLNNALTAPMMVAIEFGNGVKYVKADGVAAPYKDLLGEFLDADLYETQKDKPVVVTGIERTGQKAGKIAINGKTYTLAGMAKNVDQEQLFGMEVRAWINSNDEVLRIELNDKVMLDSLQVTITGKEVKLLGENAKYTLAKNPTIYINEEIADVDDLVKGNVYGYAKVSVDRNGDVDFIEIFEWDDYYVVEKVEDKVLYSYGEELDIKNYTIVKDGKTISIDDLEKGDMFFYRSKNAYAEVYNDSVKGEITKVFNDVMVVDGEDYEYEAGYSRYIDAYGSYDDFDADAATSMKDEGQVELFFDRLGTLAFVVGKLGESTTSTVAVYLTDDVVFDVDARGNVSLLIDGVTNKGDVVSYKVKATDLSTFDVVAKWAQDGNSSLPAKAWKDYTSAQKVALINEYIGTPTSGALLQDKNVSPAEDIEKGRIIRVTLDDNGSVTGLTLRLDKGSLTADLDLSKDNYISATSPANKAKLQSSTVIFLVEDYLVSGRAKDIKVVKVGDVKDFNLIKDDKVIGTTTHDSVAYVSQQFVSYIVAAETNQNQTDTVVAVVTEINKTAGKNEYRMKAFLDSDKETLYTAKNNNVAYSDIETEINNTGYALVELEITKDGKEVIKARVLTASERKAGTVNTVSVADNELTLVNDATVYKLVSSGLVINATSKTNVKLGKLRDIGNNDLVELALDQAGTRHTKFVVLTKDNDPSKDIVTTFTLKSATYQSVTVAGAVYNDTDPAKNEYVLKVTDVDSKTVVGYYVNAPITSSNTDLVFTLDSKVSQYGTYKLELFVTDPTNAKNLKATWDNRFLK